VLSRTVSTCLLESYDPSVVGTALFCQMVNDFFDCSNVRLLKEHQLKQNDRIKPYDSPDDERLVWMKNTFLKCLEDWKESVAQRKGSYTTGEREKMFLSHQTYEGFKITVNSHIEAIKFLLSIGFSYVLSERFMQEVLEDYTLAEQFRYND
jgi:hypothetical protein